MLFTLIGTLDPKGLLMSVSKQELIRGHLKIYEQLSQECEMQSQKVSDWEVRGPWLGSVRGGSAGKGGILGPVCHKDGIRTRVGRHPAPVSLQHSALQLWWDMASPIVSYPQASDMCMALSAGVSQGSPKTFPFSFDLE